MPIPFEIVLRNVSDGTEERNAGTIADADWKVLKSFKDYAADVRSTQWAKAGLGAHFVVQGVRRKTIIKWRKKPSLAKVRELLHCLRPFLLKNEPTFYPRVNKLLGKYLSHAFLQSELDLGRRIFHNGRFSLYGQLRVDNLPLYSSETFTRWLNAFEYHRNESDRTALANALGGTPDELGLAVFYSITADRAHMVLHLASLIAYIDRKSAAT